MTAVMAGMTLVIGHRNPDMDAIAGAMGYAYVLGQIDGGNYMAGRTGEPNKQTQFALDYFKADAPPLVPYVMPGMRVVLVDHNEPQQAVDGIAQAVLAGILDHHRLGTLATPVPIRVLVDVVGSTSTLVAEEAFARNITLPGSLAGILLSGILSDTLVFESPTCTPRDKAAAHKLAVLAGLTQGRDDQYDQAVLESIQTYGKALLKAGAGLGTRTVAEIVNSDLKMFSTGAFHYALAQTEVAGFDELPERQAELVAYLQSLIASLNHAQPLSMVLLLVTDVISNNSRILAAGEPHILAALPYPPLGDGTYDAPGVVSRKKQLLPAIESLFSAL